MSDRLDGVVKPRMLVLALLLAVVFWSLGFLLPYDDRADPAAARLVLAVTALTTTCWLTGAMAIGAASLLPIVLFPLLGVR